VIVEGNHVACQTTIAGRFVRAFTHSPVGLLPPTGQRVVFEVMNLLRYDDTGHLAEEWIQTDHRSVLRQLDADGLYIVRMLRTARISSILNPDIPAAYFAAIVG
jgi:hypothetical protein